MINQKLYIYGILYPLHFIAVISLILYPIYFDYSLKNIITLILGWILIAGVGCEIMLHRCYSHRHFKEKKFLKIPLLWLATLSLQSSSIAWASIHRGSHHKHADSIEDAHSPTKGVWYAYHGWMHNFTKYFNSKYSIDLLKDPVHVFFATNYIKIVLLSYLIVGLIDWQILLFGLMIPGIYSLHQESIINIFCHNKKLGYRNFETKDNSTNIFSIGYLMWGQGWHNNHHYKPKETYFDFGKKYEYDPCRLIIPLISQNSE